MQRQGIGRVQRITRGRAENMQGVCKEHAGSMKRTCREYAEKLQSVCGNFAENMRRMTHRAYAGNMQIPMQRIYKKYAENM